MFIQKNEKEKSTKKSLKRGEATASWAIILLGKRRNIKSESKLVGSF